MPFIGPNCCDTTLGHSWTIGLFRRDLRLFFADEFVMVELVVRYCGL